MSTIDRMPLRDVKAAVVSVTQSPMNPQRWLLILACGHEAWVTAKRRPKAKWAKCPVNPHV